jgi:hypothetical protein
VDLGAAERDTREGHAEQGENLGHKSIKAKLALFSISSTKYRLEKVVGALVHGPSYPERSVWQRPSVCAPLRATIS